jgi:hypothetical protein
MESVSPIYSVAYRRLALAWLLDFHRVLLQIPGGGGERSDELSAPRGNYAATPKMEWMNCR